MKSILAASVFLGSLLLQSQSQTGISTGELHDVFPVGAKVEQFTLTSDEQRTYYTTTSSDLWLYDRGTKNTTRIVTDSVWDVSVSPLRDALVYTKNGDTRPEQYVW